MVHAEGKKKTVDLEKGANPNESINNLNEAETLRGTESVAAVGDGDDSTVAERPGTRSGEST